MQQARGPGGVTAWRSACAALATLLIAGSVRAEDANAAGPVEDVAAARAAFARGSEAFKRGAFDEALAAYDEAYRNKALPELLFNIGQCHFQLGSFERATFFYQRFLAEAGDSPNRDVAARRLAEAETRLAEQLKLEAARLEADRLAAEAAVQERAAAEADAAIARLLEEERVAAARQRAAESSRRATEAQAKLQADAAERDAALQWAIWGGAGAGAVLIAAVATITIVALQASGDPAPPSGTLGTIDRRGG
ncbi:MAG: hypothetical protein HYS27_17160 [Deltaproteobacteria bacterium]|nr:hypothetical protein [Deltaproteobacteria bacterium]